MTNLVFSSAQHIQQKPYFVLPLDILKQAIPELGSFPYDPHDHQRPQWNGKTLILRGLKSTWAMQVSLWARVHLFGSYINDDSQKVLMNFFPNARVQTLDTGHWSTHALSIRRSVSLTVLKSSPCRKTSRLQRPCDKVYPIMKTWFTGRLLLSSQLFRSAVPRSTPVLVAKALIWWPWWPLYWVE